MSGMDDEAYARRLVAMLTSADPTGGFGRDVWVESAVVVHGPHGAELDLTFGLDVPADSDLQDVPRTGSLQLPLDAHWRELSGYADPAAYAPVVARRVEIAAGRHVQRHRPGARREAPALPGRGDQWQLLLDALRAEGEVQEVAPGRIELRDEDSALITLLVTADEWERVLIEHAWGDVDMYFADLLGPRQEDETFVVFYDGDLARSTREALPPVRGRALELRLERLRAEHPGARYAWHAYPPEPRDPVDPPAEGH